MCLLFAILRELVDKAANPAMIKFNVQVNVKPSFGRVESGAP